LYFHSIHFLASVNAVGRVEKQSFAQSIFSALQSNGKDFALKVTFAFLLFRLNFGMREKGRRPRNWQEKGRVQKAADRFLSTNGRGKNGWESQISIVSPR